MAAIPIAYGEVDQQDTGTIPPVPAPPDPATDPGVVPKIASPSTEDEPFPEDMSVFSLKPITALRMLCRSIDLMVASTDDMPLSSHTNGHTTTSEMHSASGNGGTFTAKENGHFDAEGHPEVPSVKLGSPEADLDHLAKVEDVHPEHAQRSAIIRKFYSKHPPQVSTQDYLMRLHRYCPMSTGVYLTAGLYLHRLVKDHILDITPRNVHRLLLSGLRVAMKALEDLCYPHNRFAMVGGVKGRELSLLELSFCYLTDFELQVDAPTMQKAVIEFYERELREDPADRLQTMLSAQGPGIAPVVSSTSPIQTA